MLTSPKYIEGKFFYSNKHFFKLCIYTLVFCLTAVWTLSPDKQAIPIFLAEIIHFSQNYFFFSFLKKNVSS